MLEGAGFTNIEATGDAAAVCALHAERHFDLIVLDLMMPDMDGFAVMHALRRAQPEAYLPILAVTADPELMRRALASGARDFIGKPLHVAEVTARATNLIEVGRLLRRVEARGESAMELANRRLKVLSKRVLDLQEEERHRISRELHDDIGQALVALNIGLHRLQGSGDAGAARILERCIGMADSVQGKVRELSVELRPPHLEQLGLADALRWLANRQADITGIDIRVRSTSERALGLPPEIETACYRICQEALSNATRHGHPHTIAVELVAEASRLRLSICDDGVGFDDNARRELAGGGMGLITMEERAELAGGKLEIATEVDAGTTVRAIFALPARAAKASA